MQSRLTLRAALAADQLEKFVKQEEALGVELGWDLSLSVPLHSFLYSGAYAKTYYQRQDIRMTVRYLSAFCETPHAACPTSP